MRAVEWNEEVDRFQAAHAASCMVGEALGVQAFAAINVEETRDYWAYTYLCAGCTARYRAQFPKIPTHYSVFRDIKTYLPSSGPSPGTSTWPG